MRLPLASRSRIGVASSSMWSSAPPVIVNSGLASRIDFGSAANAAAPADVCSGLNVTSMYPRLLKSSRLITTPAVGLASFAVASSTTKCSVCGWFAIPPVSVSVPGRNVTVYSPGSRVPENE